MKKKIIKIAIYFVAVFTLLFFAINSNIVNASQEAEGACETYCPGSGPGCLLHWSNDTWSTCIPGRPSWPE